MKQKPMRLGVLALLLLVIGILMATLGVLTLSTAQADLRLARRYGEMTQAQYRREAAGQDFLRQASEALERGEDLSALEGVTRNGDLFEKTITTGNTSLKIALRPGEEGGYAIVRWETDTRWVPQETTGKLWGGQED